MANVQKFLQILKNFEGFTLEQKYKIKTTMENLITMVFAHYESALEDEQYYNEGEYEFTIDGCKEFVESCGGLEEFDYYC